MQETALDGRHSTIGLTPATNGAPNLRFLFYVGELMRGPNRGVIYHYYSSSLALAFSLDSTNPGMKPNQQITQPTRGVWCPPIP